MKSHLKEISKVPWEVSPTPVTVVGTTFGNEIQTKILTAVRVQSFLLFYLNAFVTLRYFMGGN